MTNPRTPSHPPAIGIRPTIDARKGMLDVRGSLEEQTMNMAKSAAKLLTDNIKYPDGQPVRVVIADTTIGRVPETVACAEKFRREGVAVTLTVTPCWCYGAETMDMDPHTIKAVWGFNGTERPGAVYLASVLATHAQKGLPAFGIYGRDVQDADATDIPCDVQEKILRFARSAVSAALLRGKSYLQIGSVSMGIGGSIIDSDFMEDYLGMRVETVDMTEIARRISENIYDEAAYQKALAWTKANIKEGIDKNPSNAQKSREQKDKDWEFVVKMALIVKDLMSGNPNLPDGCEEERLGHNAIAAGFQGQRQWTDFYPNGDFAEVILNSSFDWDGAREPYILSTENDVLNAVTMLFGKNITGTAQLFSDVRTYWSPEAVKKATNYELESHAAKSGGFLHLINSGASCLDFVGFLGTVKPWYDISEDDINHMLEATTFCPADHGYFRGGGYSSKFLTASEMPVTMMRLNLVKGLGPVLQLVEGYTINLPHEVSEALWTRTDYTWPCTWFAPIVTGKHPFKSAYDVMNNWGANHGSISYGHIGADIITLCSILRIPVSMHNVDEKDIFRPAAWNLFGMDKEGQDYRACEVYGGMYKK